MNFGVVLLCHAAFDQARQVARHWAEAGVPVMIHVDARARGPDVDAFLRAFDDLPHVGFSQRFACEWGTFGLVEATQAAAFDLLRRNPDIGHVYLASGSCLPLRPVAELGAYLAERPRTDFIESVTTDDVPWIVDGLAKERFTLRFPFPWRTRRRFFDGYVRLQRRLGVHRRIPQGLVPHLGSQWWCLSRRTLWSILTDPRRPEFDRYFRRVWIPDESYFQTLVRLFGTRIESRSLTLSKFDVRGRPHTFYDDHLQLLRRSDCFVARKVWPGAHGLYRAFLAPRPAVNLNLEPQPAKIDRFFAAAVDRRRHGRPGLYMQGRFPVHDTEQGKTAAPYSLFHGFSDLFPDFAAWLSRTTGACVHRHLFAPERAEFAGGEGMFKGGLSDSASLRDYNPQSFLTSLIWNTRGQRQCWMSAPRDSQVLNGFIATDRNAQVSVISGAWAIPLFTSDASFAAVRAEAARLQRIETAYIARLRAPDVKARVRIWTLADFLEDPIENLQRIIDEIVPRAPRGIVEVPQMADLTGFAQFLQNLKNQGMQPTLAGDFSLFAATRPADAAHPRPVVVR